MAPNCTSFVTTSNNHHGHIYRNSATKALDRDSVTCGTDRDSIMTHSSPSSDGDIVCEDVRMVIEKLDIQDPMPRATAERPGLAQHRSKSVSTGLTSKMHHIKRNSGGLFKSFKKLGGACAAPAGGSEESVGSSGGFGHGTSGDFSSSDDDSSVGSCEGGMTGAAASRELPKRWVPRSKSQRGRMAMGGLARTKRDAPDAINTKHSIIGGSQLSGLLEEDKELGPNSEHDGELTACLNSNRSIHESCSSEGSSSEENEGRPALVRSSCLSTYSAATSVDSGVNSHFSELDNELDQGPDPFKNSRAMLMLERLGDSPSSSDLANVAAARAQEYIEECLSAEVFVLDRTKWENIPQYSKSDLSVGQHLGKGSFSDVFEVVCTVVVDDEERTQTKESWNEDREDLDRMIEAKFQKRPSVERGDDDDLNNEVEAMFREQKGREDTDELDKEIDAMFGKQEVVEDMDELDKEIDAIFGGENDLNQNEDEGDDSDKEIDSMFPSPSNGASNIMTNTEVPKQDKDWKPTAIQPRAQNRRPRRQSSEFGTIGTDAAPARSRRQTTDLGRSVCLGSHLRQHASPAAKKQTRKVVMAMKCLRPQIRSNSEQFMIGVEDLIHETAMLASLDHPHIVKLYGRAGAASASNSFCLSDGYFLLLDRLKETLDEQIGMWKKTLVRKAPPGLAQVKCAVSIADALSYLHSKKIIFRDLKPANVGYDSQGVLKLFDFGFAIGVDEPLSPSTCSSNNSEDEKESHLLYDKCGTPRYMAPEVGLELGYTLPADVYSFGILLWEICALKKPFGNVRSANEFHKIVFEKGARPKINKRWPSVLKDLITGCWSSFPAERPDTLHIKSMLAAHARELSAQGPGHARAHKGLRGSIVFRRLTG